MTYHDKTRFAGIELKGEGDPTPADDPSAIVTKALGDLTTTVDARFKAIETKPPTLTSSSSGSTRSR